MPIFDPTMPKPVLDDPDTEAFWDACREHRLVVQRCSNCRTFRFAPVPLCFQCLSTEYEWVESKGTGEVYTWTVCHRSAHPATTNAVPYNVVVVRLDDCGGALITSNLVGAGPNDGIHAGMRVAVVWDDLDDCTLPRFERDGPAA